MLKTYIGMNNRLKDLQDRFTKDENGAALIEYSVLIGLITVAAIGAIIAVGGWVVQQWTALEGALGIGGGGG